MPKKRKPRQPGIVLEEIQSDIESFRRKYANLTLRGKIKELTTSYLNFKDLGVSIAMAHYPGIKSGKDRIRNYLIENVGEVIDAVELEIVSGISEYARRVRELRVQEGYPIISGASPDSESSISLRPDQYMLVSANPDGDAARRWKIANAIRRTKKGSRQKLLEYFQENVGVPVHTEELYYVSNEKKEYARRVRELRTEDGFPIATHFTGRPDLQPEYYVLLSKDRVAEPHDRHIPNEVQKLVYSRDENRCRLCGWSMEKWSKKDPRILELHHLRRHAEGGHNEPENLIVICSRCHDEVHAGRLSIPFEKA